MSGSRYGFGKCRRLRRRAEFAAVFQSKVRQTCGPLLIYARPNNLRHCRLGLSTSKQVGNAVRRNRIKRLIREAFRLSQYDLAAGYDLLIVVRPHEPLSIGDYQKLLMQATTVLDAKWRGRPR